MMRGFGKILSCVVLVVCILSTLTSTYTFTAGNGANPSVPHDNGGKKWRIAYCEPEPFVNYASTFYNLIMGLKEMGWLVNIDELPYTKGQNETESMWKWLSEHDTGPYIEFIKDGFYTFFKLEGKKLEEVKANMISRLNQKKDIDLVLAMGTGAGKTLANNKHSVPTLVLSTSNAVQSGIIKSVEDSGSPHLWAHMNPYRYRRQIEVFHDSFKFKKIGIVYEDTQAGRSYAAIEDMEQVAKEKGFEIISHNVVDANTEECSKQLMDAYKSLAGKVDAMYMSVYTWRDVKKLPQYLEPFFEKKLPVFSQQGEAEVKYGALMSVYRADYKGIGSFAADTVTKVLCGTPPQKLPQVFEDTPSIVLNLETAKRIGFKPPFKMLLIADNIYTTIGDK